MRSEAGGPPEAVLVLGSWDTSERPRGRRPRAVDSGAPARAPTTRATVVRAEPFAGAEAAAAWLDALRADADAARAELEAGLRVLNRAQRARRAATADPSVGELSAERALAARVGYGSGDEVAAGRFAAALELPPTGGQRRRRSMEAPDERFAALLGGRVRALVAEELVLRARADLHAGRPREAALQARVALEALLAEAGTAAVAEHRSAVAQAAARALDGELAEPDVETLSKAVAAMEAALRRVRLGGGGADPLR